MINGYNEKLSFCEDWDFFYRASSRFNFKNDEEALILYRIHDSNMSIQKLEETVIYSLYVSHDLPESSLDSSILKMAQQYPELIREMNQKIINFFSFWIDIYTKFGYTKLTRKLFNQVVNNYFLIFNKQEKTLYIKNNLIISTKNFDMVNTMFILKKYLL